MSQRTEAWLKMRAGKFTGSRFADLMAKTQAGKPAASRANLLTLLAVERLTGTCVETYSNAAMERGSALEEEARQAFEARIGELCVVRDFIPHPTLPNVGVSPDGEFSADDGVEIKCPMSMAKHLDALRTGAHAEEYRWQVQGQIMCAGWKRCHVVSYDPRFPEGLRLAVTVVERDDKAIAELEAACIAADAEVTAMVDELINLEKAA
jgi:putative phage-type endonuclease